jgi:hypothetical protein
MERLGRRSLGKISTAVAALVFGITGAASAHGPNGTLSEAGYQRMRQMAHDLDERARHAADQAEHEGNWFYRHDRDFRRSIANFAREASQFHARMDEYRTAPWQVDEELRSLLRDARRVQRRLQGPRSAEEHTVADWNQTVRLLNGMIRVYQNDMAGRYPADHTARGDRDYQREGAYPPNSIEAGRGDYQYGREDLVSLAHELEQRSARVADSARQVANPSPFGPTFRQSADAIQHFAEQAAAFHELVEKGLSQNQLRANVTHLIEDARTAGNQVRAENLSPQMRNDWNAVLQLVDRIRRVSGV